MFDKAPQPILHPPSDKSSRFQFSVSRLLAAVTIVAIFTGWWVAVVDNTDWSALAIMFTVFCLPETVGVLVYGRAGFAVGLLISGLLSLVAALALPAVQ